MLKKISLMASAFFSLLALDAHREKNTTQESKVERSSHSKKKRKNSKKKVVRKTRKEEKGLTRKSSKKRIHHSKKKKTQNNNGVTMSQSPSFQNLTPRTTDTSFEPMIDKNILEEASKVLQQSIKEENDKAIQELKAKIDSLTSALGEVVKKANIFMLKEDFNKYHQEKNKELVSIVTDITTTLTDSSCCCGTKDLQQKITEELNLSAFDKSASDSLWTEKAKDFGYSESIARKNDALLEKINNSKKMTERRPLRKEMIVCEEILEERAYQRILCTENDLNMMLDKAPALEKALLKGFEDIKKNVAPEEIEKLPKETRQQALWLLSQSVVGTFDTSVFLFLMGADADHKDAILNFGQKVNKDIAIERHLCTLKDEEKTEEKKAEIKKHLDGVFGSWAREDFGDKTYEDLLGDLQDALLLMGSANLSIVPNKETGKPQRTLVAPYGFTKFIAVKAPETQERAFADFLQTVAKNLHEAA